MGIEPTIRVLQTLALPLGDVAVTHDSLPDAPGAVNGAFFTCRLIFYEMSRTTGTGSTYLKDSVMGR